MEWESQQFRHFARLLGLSAVSWRRALPPAPDILFTSGVDTIGVEITRFFGYDSDPLDREGAQAAVLVDAAEAYREAGNPPVKVIVNWAAPAPRRHGAKRDFALKLASLVAANLPPTSRVTFIRGDTTEAGGLPIEVSQVWIERSFSLHASTWGSGGGGEVPPAMPSDIQRVLDKKASRAATYRRSCDAIWLLIVEDQEFMASWIFLPAYAAEHIFQAPFDRLFFLETAPERLTELECRPIVT